MEELRTGRKPTSGLNRWNRGINALLVVVTLAAVALFTGGEDTRAASTYCGTHGTTSSIGGTSVFTQLQAYGDPACTGTRARQFYHTAYTSPSTTLSYIGFEPTVGLRAWDCGTQYYGWTYGVGSTPSIGLFGQWSSSNNCGFQGDQNTKFVKSGYSDVWVYAYY